jgi:putative YhdH/YhfP family quinone oxidoreductase
MTSTAEAFRAFRIRHDDQGYRAGIETMRAAELSSGELLVRVDYSSVNYKDALAGTGQGKILRRFPLNGGIDAAGHVVASTDPAFREGDAVLCTGSGLSETRDGGYAEYARFESATAIAVPGGLTLREAMILGTAGFTAALSLYRMEQNAQAPAMGPIAVTGASGGVGMLAIDILARAGYEVDAITGKSDHADFLRAIGASTVTARQDVDWGSRPLESARWAGAVDNVGGDTLAGLCRMLHPYGNVASCGMAGGSQVHGTVMPHIIRGVSILGIASAGTAIGIRRELWRRLASDWKPANLGRICTQEVALEQLPGVFPGMLAGGSFGRTVVKI